MKKGQYRWKKERRRKFPIRVIRRQEVCLFRTKKDVWNTGSSLDNITKEIIGDFHLSLILTWDIFKRVCQGNKLRSVKTNKKDFKTTIVNEPRKDRLLATTRWCWSTSSCSTCPGYSSPTHCRAMSGITTTSSPLPHSSWRRQTLANTILSGTRWL